MKKLSIIIPFLNEEKTLAVMLNAVLAVDLGKIGYSKEIILVNDGSKDNSKKVLEPFLMQQNPDVEIKYVENIKNSGKGFSLKEGFKNATGDVLIIQDADMEYDPNDYISLLQKMESKNYDLIYGSRIRGILAFHNNYSHMSFLIGGLAVSFLTSLFTFKFVTDEPTCYKLFSKRVQKFLTLPPENGFEWEPAITMLLLRKGFKYGEVPIHYKARKIEEGKKIKWIDGVKAITTLWKWLWEKI